MAKLIQCLYRPLQITLIMAVGFDDPVVPADIHISL
jgi:hypothetical protein